MNNLPRKAYNLNKYMIWSYVLIWFVEKVEQVFEELIYASQFGEINKCILSIMKWVTAICKSPYNLHFNFQE